MIDPDERRDLAAASCIPTVGITAFATTWLLSADITRSVVTGVFLAGVAIGFGVLGALIVDGFLTRTGVVALAAYAVAGFCAGGVVSLMFLGAGLPTALACGLMSGIVFWSIRRPDRSDW